MDFDHSKVVLGATNIGGDIAAIAGG